MTEVHPIIRLATSSLVYLDKDIIVTDAKRSPEDYRRMGLQAKKHSLHYKQQDGYSYALDLRTKGRSEFSNTLTSAYFRAMGFNVLRHGGTADHLHISLFNPDKPYSK